MTVDEIFSTLASHMIRGMMTHEQMANYYDFLGLSGYKECHEYHFMHETCTYRKLCKYFISHHNKLIPHATIEDPRVVSDNWYRYTRQDVDNNTKKTGVRNGLNLWIAWEQETKKLYEQMYKELMDINEIADTEMIRCLIEDVSCELKKAEKYQLNKKAIDYDLISIVGEQHELKCKYAEKIQEIGTYLC